MRCLLCSLDSPGFLYPHIGIAQALVAHGHEVAFVTNAKWHPFLTGLGLTRIPCGSKDQASFQVGQWYQPLAAALQVKHIEYALSSFHADALLGQALTLGPLLVGEKIGLPVGLLGFCTYLWPLRDDPPSSEEKSALDHRRDWCHQDMLKWLNRSRELFHLNPRRDGCRESSLQGDLFFLRSIPELEPDTLTLPDRVHLVGGCLWDPDTLDAELENWLAQTERARLPLIYVQHGRFFHVRSFWPSLVEALGRIDCCVVASVGRLDKEIGALPENFFVRPHISQRHVLSKACMVVASANTTAVLGALAAGVPSLLIPAGGEQPNVAELARRGGFARVLLPEDATTDQIKSSLDGILEDSSYKSKALFYGEALSKIDSFGKIVELAEGLAEG